MARLPAQPNQSLLDGLACLQELAVHREPIGSRELARRLDLDPTRVNRLLKTLAFVGLAEQTERKKYRPGPAIHVLAAQSLFGSGLIQKALPALESLRRFGFTVAMGVIWRDQMCYLYRGEPDLPVTAGLGRFLLNPATGSGPGTALLAHEPEERIRELYAAGGLRQPLAGTPEPKLEGRGGILARLARVRVDGYALVSSSKNEDRALGVVLGSPPYAGIGLSGRFPDHQIGKLVDALREAVVEIQKEDGADR